MAGLKTHLGIIQMPQLVIEREVITALLG